MTSTRSHPQVPHWWMDEKSGRTFREKFDRVDVVLDKTLGGAIGVDVVSVIPVWKDVDRPTPFSWALKAKGKKLIQRLKKAIEEGAVYSSVKVLVDSYGKTYVDTTHRVMSRCMSADLKRLGY